MSSNASVIGSSDSNAITDDEIRELNLDFLSINRNVDQVVSQQLSSTPISESDHRRLRFTSAASINLSPIREHEVPNSDTSSSSHADLTARRLQRKRVNRGQDWVYFKPLHEDSIYYSIVMNPNDIMMEVRSCLQLYEENVNFRPFLQFFSDVTGFQELKLPKNIEKRENYIDDITQLMEDNIPKYQKETGKYLFKLTSTQALEAQNGIFKFLTKLTLTLHETNLMYNTTLMLQLFNLLSVFTLSSIKSIHHTGVVLVAKITTVLLEIEREVKIQIERNSSNVLARREKYNEQEISRYLNELIVRSQKIMENNCWLKDPQLFNMKISILEEMWMWFKINPHLLIPTNTKYFKKLMELVESDQVQLRLAALKLCHNLIKEEEFENYLTPVMDKFVKIVKGRLKDIEDDVIVLTVNIFTSMLNRYPMHITDETQANIMMFVYNKHYLLAVAAGEFISVAFRVNDNGNQSASVIIKELLNLHKLCKRDYLIPLLVDSVLPSIPEILNWKVLILLLQTDGVIEHSDQKVLIKIMSASMQQVVIGFCSKHARLHAHSEGPSRNEVRKIVDHLLPNLLTLINKYQNDTESVQELLDVLLVLDYQDAYLSKYRQTMYEILKKLNNIFAVQSNEKLLGSISQIFAVVCDQLCPINQRAGNLLKIMKQVVINGLTSLLGDLNDSDRTLSNEQTEELEFYFLQLSALFAHHNLNKDIEMDLVINIMFQYPKEYTENTVTYFVRSYLSHLLCKLDDIISSKEIEQLTAFKTETQKFIKNCFTIMMSARTECRFELFHCLCNIHLKVQKQLGKLTKMNDHFKLALPSAFSEEEGSNLIKIAEEILFKDQDVAQNYSVQYQALHNVLNMSNLDIIHPKELVRLFQHYFSHYIIYGKLMDEYIKMYDDMDCITLPAFVMKTLVFCYMQLIVDDTIVLEQVDDHLKKLALHFLKFMSKKPEKLQVVIKFGFQYAIGNQIRLKFLKYVRYFVAPLSKGDKQKIKNSLVPKIPNEFKKDVSILTFFSYFKNTSKNKTAVSEQSNVHISNVTSDVTGDESAIIDEYMSDMNIETDASEAEDNIVIEDVSSE